MQRLLTWEAAKPPQRTAEAAAAANVARYLDTAESSGVLREFDTLRTGFGVGGGRWGGGRGFADGGAAAEALKRDPAAGPKR